MAVLFPFSSAMKNVYFTIHAVDVTGVVAAEGENEDIFNYGVANSPDAFA